MRINQWISHNTKYSRREADNLIKNNKVRIDSNVASFGAQVSKGQKVYINNKRIFKLDSNKYTLIAYNKPKGEIVSKKDDRNRRLIYDTLDNKFSHFIPVGRLDYASEGLLLLSDNPRIARALMESNLIRVYNLKLDSKLNNQILDAMRDGLKLDNALRGAHKNTKIISMEFAPFAFCDILKESLKYTKIKVGILEGKNRELRRFFAHFGINILDLKRVKYGFVELNALPSAKSRYLTKKEYSKLRLFLQTLQDSNSE